MRAVFERRAEDGRVLTGEYGSRPGKRYGAFRVYGPCGLKLLILADDGALTGWEHVSVSSARRAPNWQEMCFVKDLFWEKAEAVMQLHPPEADYINNHPNTLHLWKGLSAKIPLPPSSLVGYKELNPHGGT
jgi:hypothetical protein